MRERSSADLNSASVVPSGRKSQSCPTRERTDLAAFPLNLPLSGRSRAAMASLSVRKSSVPWWRTRPLWSLRAVPETLSPATVMSLRPEASARTPREASASQTGRVKLSKLSAASSPASVMKE